MKIFTKLIVLILLSILSISCGNSKSGSPKAVNGFIDLSGYDFTVKGYARLDGEWNFRWRRLLTPSEMRGSTGEHYTVPGSWEKQKTSSDGFGTLSIVVAKGSTGTPLALKIPSVSSAYKIWVDDNLVCTNGTVSETAAGEIPVWLPRVVPLPGIKGNTMQITMQLSNFHDRRDGFWGSIILGSAESINRVRDRTVAFELFIFGSVFIIALYHFSLYALRREDMSVFYFAMTCLLLALRTITSGECFITLATAIPSIYVYKTLFIAFFMLIPAALMYFRHLYPYEVSDKIRYVSVVTAVVSAVMIVMPLKVITSAVIVYEILAILMLIFCTVSLVRAKINRRDGAGLFLAGWSVFCLTAVNDILFDLGIIWTGLIAPFGMLFFIFSQAFMHSFRYANAFRTIEVMRNDLQTLDVLKDEFLANTSHELKTPLNGIIGLASSLSDGARGTLPDDARSDLDMIATSGKRLSFLVNDILDFSRLKNMDVALHIGSVDIRSIVDSVIHLTKPLLNGDTVELINSIPTDLPLIDGDENRLQQIFYNLIGNAIKFTESGRIEIDSALTDYHSKRMIRVSVKDTGIGIEREKQHAIFEAFTQADGSISRTYGGTGIGLSITKQLVTLHGGFIEVDSEPGKGSTFTVLIPVNTSSATQIGTDSSIKGSAEERMYPDRTELLPERQLIPRIVIPRNDSENYHADSTILIVDDDPVNLRVLENYLGLENYTVKKTRYGIEALNIIENDGPVDLVLLDVMMPRVTGYDVAKRIREKFAHFDLPIIMLTAKNQIADIVTGIEVGANDYLSKPFDKRELLARVNSLLRLKTSVQESRKLAVLEQDLVIARHIQLSTMPSEIPVSEKIKIAVRYIPMESIGGDFYTFHVVDSGRIGILLTDVTGHGIPAALIASMLKIVSTILAEYAETPDRFLTEINRMMTGNMGDHFLTAAYLFIDAEKKKLYHANAGHQPVLIMKRGGATVLEDKPKGGMIGLKKDNRLELSVRDIESGDRIVIYTDCIVETFSSTHELFTIDHFKRALLNTVEMDEEECAGYIYSLLKEWTGNKGKFDDDFSLIIADIK